jgi:transcriptional regulator with XRE-family HTH domain
MSKTDEPSLEAINQTERAYFRALGNRIAQLRRQHDMTQAELAQFLGVSQQTIFSYEAGARRVRLDQIPSFMKILGVSCEELIGIKPLSPPPSSEVIPARLLRHVGNLKRLSAADQGVIIRIAETMLFSR